MTPPEFSVLLLAWDDADPGVAVLGGAALPPTLALVYQLATQHPVLALYPHLPASEATDATPPAGPAAAASAAAGSAAGIIAAPAVPSPTPPLVAAAGPPSPLETAVAMPGVRLLLNEPTGSPPVHTLMQPLTSRIVGLADMLPTGLPVLPGLGAPASLAASIGANGTAAGPPAASRSQWPTGPHAPVVDFTRRAGRPAAPYLGASAVESFPPPPPAPPRQPRPIASAPVPMRPTSHASPEIRPAAFPQAGDLRFDPDPDLPILHPSWDTEEETEGIGPAEANALSAPEDDLTLDALPPETALVAAVAALPRVAVKAAAITQPPPKAAAVVQLPALDNLNFRMIQYARQAARLMQGRTDFGVIYAPNWPAWLAALEIRNSSRLPLVLYAATLAADFASPAERGWLLEVERMTLRRAHLILVPDEAARRHLHGHYGDLPGEVRVVPAHDEAAVQEVLSEVALPR